MEVVVAEDRRMGPEPRRGSGSGCSQRPLPRTLKPASIRRVLLVSQRFQLSTSTQWGARQGQGFLQQTSDMTHSMMYIRSQRDIGKARRGSWRTIYKGSVMKTR